ncbi:MAG: EAL domain-containing protein [Pseudomonadota bacterium]
MTSLALRSLRSRARSAVSRLARCTEFRIVHAARPRGWLRRRCAGALTRKPSVGQACQCKKVQALDREGGASHSLGSLGTPQLCACWQGASVERIGCSRCRDGQDFNEPFTFAFQPIVDVNARRTYAYEALVRGPNGESAASVLGALTDENRYSFDQAARTKAIELAANLMPDCDALLSINIFPNAIYNPVRCLRATLSAAEQFGFDPRRLMFEATEHEEITDVKHLKRIFDHYESCGFTTAIDDFGAGFAGLSLLADFIPQIIKLDMALVRNIHNDPVRQAIVGGLVGTAQPLNIRIVAEGVEVAEEMHYLIGVGITLFQGYLLARPGLETLPAIDLSALSDVEQTSQTSATPENAIPDDLVESVTESVTESTAETVTGRIAGTAT